MSESSWLVIIIGIVIGIVLLFIEYRTKWFARSLKSSSEKRLSAGFKKSLSPMEIVEEIKKQPLLRKEIAGESYVGLKVEWQLTLWALHTVDANTVRLMMFCSKRYPWVYCTVNVLEHPEVKIAKEGAGVWVAGEISKVEGHDITLIDCTIEFN